MVKRRRVLFIQLSQFRVFVRKLAVTIIFFAALLLLVLSKADSAHVNKAEDFVSRMLYPVIRVLQIPADGIYFCYDSIRDIVKVYHDNKALKQELFQFNRLKKKHQALKIENDVLSQMLHYTPPPEASYVTAKVIAGQGDSFAHSIVAYVPETVHIKKGSVVMNQETVIGRVESIHGEYVRILLVSDINSKIPVFNKRTRGRGILSGNNSSKLSLLFMGSDADVVVGDRIVTSGIGGIFPSDLEIGYVSQISQGEIEVQPIIPIESIEYVEIVDYGLTDTLLRDNN